MAEDPKIRWGRGKGPGVIALPERRALFETDPEAEKARQDALRLLGRRAYTRKEVVERLQRREHAEGAIVKVVEALERSGILDDRAFAVSFVTARMRLRPCGPAVLRRDLLRRGVDVALTEEAVATAFDPPADGTAGPGDAFQAAFDLLRNRKSRYLGLAKPKALQRMYGFLGRWGFPPDVAREACERAWAAFGDEGTHDAS